MKRCLFNSVIVVCAVFVSGALAQGVKYESSLTLDAGKKGGEETKKSQTDSQYSAVQGHLGELKETIASAIEKMKLTSGTNDERLKAVDDLIAQLKEVEQTIDDKSELSISVEKTLKNNQEKWDEYKKKTSDPNLKAEIRAGYEGLVAKFGNNVSRGYEIKLLLGKQASEMHSNIELVTQKKQLMADYFLADETEEALKILAQVVVKASEVNGDLGKMVHSLDFGEKKGEVGETQGQR